MNGIWYISSSGKGTMVLLKNVLESYPHMKILMEVLPYHRFLDVNTNLSKLEHRRNNELIMFIDSLTSNLYTLIFYFPFCRFLSMIRQDLLNTYAEDMVFCCESSKPDFLLEEH
jgi:hypothetical protein